MTNASKPVAVSILDKEYVLACADSERESLMASVTFLNAKMREVRDSGNIVGSERVAVVAALKIAHEYLSYKQRKEDYTKNVDANLQRIGSKIAGVLLCDAQAE